jgi:hypothetical protein
MRKILVAAVLLAAACRSEGPVLCEGCGPNNECPVSFMCAPQPDGCSLCIAVDDFGRDAGVPDSRP